MKYAARSWLGALGALALGVAWATVARAQAATENEPAEAPHANDAEATAAPEESADDGASSATLLGRAEEAVTNVDYQRSRRLSERALTRGGLTIDEVARAYRVLGVACAQLDDAPCAEQAFLRLFALEPKSNIAMRLSPARRSAVMNARGFWSVHKDGFTLDVDYARHERQVVVRLADPIAWAAHLEVWVRFGERPYVKAEGRADRELTVDVPDAAPLDSVEVYAFALDAQRNVLLQFGREREPHVFAPSEEELSAELRRDIRGGQTGSFARRLEELGVQVGVHGYASLELKPVNGNTSFDLHHATAMIRANLRSTVSVELAMEWEHLGLEQDDFYLPHAFVDVKASDLLVLRAGFFEAPVGAFNEYLYPDFLRITGLPPLFSISIVPALWSEVGVQLRGRYEFARRAAFTYAAFVSNGLEQRDSAPTDGVLQEGGDIAEMRFNARDQFSSNKAVGGRLGVEIAELDAGVSGYSGRYTIERARELSLLDADLSYRGKWLTARAEAALALQEITGRTLRKYGGYALVAARPEAHVEPYAQYDLVNDADGSGDLQRGLLGVALYPFPDERATRSLRLKNEAGFEFREQSALSAARALPRSSVHASFVWFFQLTTGF